LRIIRTAVHRGHNGRLNGTACHLRVLIRAMSRTQAGISAGACRSPYFSAILVVRSLSARP
jgi:hypothetical protein